MFVTIYIAEAHAVDEWPLGRHTKIKQHKTLDDRVNAAKSLQELAQERKLNIGSIAVDDIDNKFTQLFACHPERFFVIYRGKLTFKPKPVEATYLVSDVAAHLKTLF